MGGRPADQRPVLRMEEVSRHYAGRLVLDRVDLAVPPGATVALRGPNGAGKTTLLRLAATLIHPTGGRVAVAGHDTRRDALACRRRLAYVPQDAPLYDELTPVEHVAWWAALHGHRLSSVAARAAVAAAGLTAKADARCRTLSRGQRQRTAIACALATQAPLLLLDEPFAALDEAGAAWLEQALAARRHGTTLLVDHDAARMQRLADTIHTLTEGRLQ